MQEFWKVRIALIAGVIMMMTLVSSAAAQSRSVFWERWNVTIDNIDTVSNRFDVTEDYLVLFSGAFSFGTVEIPLSNLERISNVQVIDQGTPLTSSCRSAAGTFCASTTNNNLSIVYYFTESIRNTKRQITIRYTVDGALRVYPDGDQLWWAAIPEEHFGFPIGSATITVELPPDFAPREGIDPIITEGAPGAITVNGSVVTARATRQISGDEPFIIRVQYPHDPNARVASWQADFDSRREFDENVKPLIDIGVIGLSFVVGLGGIFFIFARYRTSGQDPKVGPVPTFLTEPPSDLSPATVGTLLDESADVRDVMSIILDMARRGYLVIEETMRDGLFGIGQVREFSFKRTDKPLNDLRPFERRLIDNIFSGGRMERSLDSMRNVFYMTIARIQDDLYQELVAQGLYPDNPKSVRGRWVALGMLLGLFAGAIAFVLISAVDSLTGSLFCIPIALGAVGVSAMAFASGMPAKSRAGAEEAAKWNAFREYLRNLDKYDQAERVAAKFDQYLPYAVAFGIDRSWVQRFQRVEQMSIPPWYFPTYLGGPYRRGYVPGTPLGRPFSGTPGMGDIARADMGGSLDDVAGNISRGLESMSTGLTTMMESASRVMTSRPQSASGSGSWSSGGRGWSGGGFSGGGSSGGGSRGFG